MNSSFAPMNGLSHRAVIEKTSSFRDTCLALHATPKKKAAGSGLSLRIPLRGKQTRTSVFAPVSMASLWGLYVRGLLAFWALRNLKLDLLAFLERLESAHLDRGEVRKQIFTAVIRGNEAVPLCIIEPLYRTCWHRTHPQIRKPGKARNYACTSMQQKDIRPANRLENKHRQAYTRIAESRQSLAKGPFIGKKTVNFQPFLHLDAHLDSRKKADNCVWHIQPVHLYSASVVGDRK